VDRPVMTRYPHLATDLSCMNFMNLDLAWGAYRHG
jgi:hypothetical protein